MMNETIVVVALNVVQIFPKLLSNSMWMEYDQGDTSFDIYSREIIPVYNMIRVEWVVAQ